MGSDLCSPQYFSVQSIMRSNKSGLSRFGSGAFSPYSLCRRSHSYA